MKIGIITFRNANNYGAVLQNYALTKAISSIDNSVEVKTIDYHSSNVERNYYLWNFSDKGTLIND